MFHIIIADIGGDGIVVDFNSTLETLAEVEIFVTSSINRKLAVTKVILEHVEDLVYTVWLHGHDIGIVSIKDINPTPIKRK